jgi:ABC-type bacteriocin/lantibiotic exporter with double-glycine peptidase domain
MVSTYFGKPQSIAMLREYARTDRRGTSLAGLIRAASRIGFDGRGVRASNQVLAGIPLPAIAHWNEKGRNHFVVLYEITDDVIMIGDPAAGLRRMTPARFQACWTGILLLLAPSPDPDPPDPESGARREGGVPCPNLETEGNTKTDREKENGHPGTGWPFVDSAVRGFDGYETTPGRIGSR